MLPGHTLQAWVGLWSHYGLGHSVLGQKACVTWSCDSMTLVWLWLGLCLSVTCIIFTGLSYIYDLWLVLTYTLILMTWLTSDLTLTWLIILTLTSTWFIFIILMTWLIILTLTWTVELGLLHWLTSDLVDHIYYTYELTELTDFWLDSDLVY